MTPDTITIVTIIGFLILIAVAIFIVFAAVGSFIRGFAISFSWASGEFGFLGVVVCAVAWVLAFPVMAIVFAFVGWKVTRTETIEYESNYYAESNDTIKTPAVIFVPQTSGRYKMVELDHKGIPKDPAERTKWANREPPYDML